MNYRAASMHLAACCREYLGAEKRIDDVGPGGGFVVGEPMLSSDYDGYDFLVGELARMPKARWERKAEQKFVWRAFVVVTRQRDVFFDRIRGRVPPHVEECIERGCR